MGEASIARTIKRNARWNRIGYWSCNWYGYQGERKQRHKGRGCRKILVFVKPLR